MQFMNHPKTGRNNPIFIVKMILFLSVFIETKECHKEAFLYLIYSGYNF